MNSERQLDDFGNSISLFRSAFKALVGKLMAEQINPAKVSDDELLSRTPAEKKKLEWYVENDGVSERDMALFDLVMLDYLHSLQTCLSDHDDSERSIKSCLQLLLN